jgi:hypothetical protein
MIIAGELGSSEYVFQQIRNTFFQLQARILRPDDPSVTTIKGCILAGLAAMTEEQASR